MEFLTSTYEFETCPDDPDRRAEVLEQPLQFEEPRRAHVDLLPEVRVLQTQLAIYAGLGTVAGGVLMRLVIVAVSTILQIEEER